VAKLFAGSSSYDPSLRPVVTIGNFDGVHLGHQALLRRTIARAREAGRPACAFTFDPLPVEVLRPQARAPRVQTHEERLAGIGAAGVDHIVVERFDLDFARHDPSWFVEEVVRGRLGAVAVVVGWDFRFGRDRAGTLADLGRAVEVESFGPWSIDEEAVSSSRIRARVLEGDVVGAARLLGRPHRVRGPVVHGDGRGRTIGVPTANVAPLTELRPARGVYACRVVIDGQPLPAAANIGVRPTFDGQQESLEVHLLDWSGDLYGQVIDVEFIARIRGEQRFDGPEALIAQIRRDLEAARELTR
jgi:riboflavin kinase/FMN adenylyltransferase